ncbi:tetratricopeptide repeat protein [Cellvibrio sp.]|uniref:tetratricopeptide repeat protein n=1 Tax=Cellvibrio sp. TaxID=1965322 RepID=UPI0039647C0F
MKFNNPLLALLLISVIFSGCSSNSEKPIKDKSDSAAPKEIKNASSEQPAAKPTSAIVPSSVLPVGPVMPNPYLQNPQKLSEQVEVNFHDAVVSIQQKNWDRAEAVLKQLAEKNPKLSGVHLNLGIVYRNKGDAEKAAAEFNRAINANPKNVDAYNQLAVLKREAGDFASAESLYQKALGVWPFYPEGHKNIAILYDLYLGKPEQALPHYQAYQQLLSAPDKQVDSWVADLQRRLNGGKATEKAPEKEEQK